MHTHGQGKTNLESKTPDSQSLLFCSISPSANVLLKGLTAACKQQEIKEVFEMRKTGKKKFNLLYAMYTRYIWQDQRQSPFRSLRYSECPHSALQLLAFHKFI